MTKKLIYQGKAKAIFEIEGNDNQVLQVFQDSITAFNNPEKFIFKDKGLISCQISTKVFEFLMKSGIKTHLISSEGDSQIVQKLTILPLEVTVRNYAFGGILKKSHFTKGDKLSLPLIEFMYKKDEFGDPLISEDYVLKYLLNGNEKLFHEIKRMTNKINQLLIDFFDKIDIILCDFKIEFGINNKNELLLGDEMSCDTCRLMDKNTRLSLDKDIFRNKEGDVMDGYREVLRRINEQYN